MSDALSSKSKWNTQCSSQNTYRRIRKVMVTVMAMMIEVLMTNVMMMMLMMAMMALMTTGRLDGDSDDDESH